MLILLTGEKNSGKTEKAQLLYQRLTDKGFSVSGIISKAEIENNIKKCYYTVDLQSGKKKLLASKEFTQGGRKFRDFYFLKEGFDFADRVLTKNLKDKLKIIDEIGQLEIRKKGFYGTVKFLIKHYTGHLILVVRKSNIENVVNIFGLKEHCEVNINTNTEENIMKKITK